jgi:cyclopropane-fatty-acyl-phospholipid synthase
MSLRPRQIVTEYLSECDVRVNGDAPYDIRVNNSDFFGRALINGSLGLGESYVDGWWDAQDLEGFIYRLLVGQLDERVWTWRATAAYCLAAMFNFQSRSRAFQIGERHYDIGNDLYERMLDRRMIYSCGYWESASTLEAAQEAKLNLVFGKLQLQKGHRVLDIGCGWGGALKLAATLHDIEGVGITVSQEQAEYARKVCEGLPVVILLKDYRDITATFDRVFSIGMFEHVGFKNYRTYMETVRRSLRPDGRFLLHTIGSVSPSNHSDPWIVKYIFPNSMLPSQQHVVQAMDGLFSIDGWQRIGKHYEPTLLAWRDNFEKYWPELKATRDERFFRMWRYYLSSSAACFRAGITDVWQVLLTPDRERAGRGQKARKPARQFEGARPVNVSPDAIGTG